MMIVMLILKQILTLMRVSVRMTSKLCSSFSATDLNQTLYIPKIKKTLNQSF